MLSLSVIRGRGCGAQCSRTTSYIGNRAGPAHKRRPRRRSDRSHAAWVMWLGLRTSTWSAPCRHGGPIQARPTCQCDKVDCEEARAAESAQAAGPAAAAGAGQQAQTTREAAASAAATMRRQRRGGGDAARRLTGCKALPNAAAVLHPVTAESTSAQHADGPRGTATCRAASGGLRGKEGAAEQLSKQRESQDLCRVWYCSMCPWLVPAAMSVTCASKWRSVDSTTRGGCATLRSSSTAAPCTPVRFRPPRAKRSTSKLWRSVEPMRGGVST